MKKGSVQLLFTYMRRVNFGSELRRIDTPIGPEDHANQG